MAKRVIFGKNMFFLNFSRFLQKYRISVYISIIYAPKKRGPISINPQRVGGNYSVVIFFSTYQVDESRNQKCGTHIKKLTAMKFRYLENVSNLPYQLRKSYLEKNKNWVKV